jgi:hypothetical protein
MTRTKITIYVDGHADPTAIALVLSDSLHNYTARLERAARQEQSTFGANSGWLACGMLRRAIAGKSMDIEYEEVLDE